MLELESKNSELLRNLANQMMSPGPEFVGKFIDNDHFRKDLLKVLSRFPIHLISGFISFLDKYIDETWRRSEPRGAFEGYNQNLSIILDILTAFDVHRMPPALVQTTAYALQRVAYYIGYEPGKSWSAAKTWHSRRGDLSAEMVKELRDVSEQHGYNWLRNMLVGM
jgi:hypothetical protein